MVDWETYGRPEIRNRRRPIRHIYNESSTSSTTTDSEGSDLPTQGKSISKVAVRSFFIDFES